MKILFIHNNYPAQFGKLALWLAQHGWDVTFATARDDAYSAEIKIVKFKPHREPSPRTHHYLTGTERAVITGQGLARTALQLLKQGYEPDIVVAHSGWGVGFFVKDIWPKTKYVQYAEWYYNFPPSDETPHFQTTNWIEESARARIRNAPFWLDFSAADATICPTAYQASRFPEKIQNQITVLSDGFDTTTHSPAPRDTTFLEKEGIPPNAKVLTYIARGMEPTRGFPEVMKAISGIQKIRQDVHAVIIAQDRVAYGQKKAGQSWKAQMLDELNLDEERLHFTGLVPRAKMVKFLQASDAHLYFSAPFVLSWSFVEAMACAAPIVAARSAPVEEFMTDQVSGLLVDPFDTEQVVGIIQQVLDNKNLAQILGSAARSEITKKYDAETLVFPEHARFLANLVTTVEKEDLPESHSQEPFRSCG